jgi:hypothetical protein
MKTSFFWRSFAALALLAIAGCGPAPASYRVELPSLPPAWDEILGPPHWRLEWYNEAGQDAFWEGAASEKGPPALSFMDEWASPVLAWPYWPEKGLFPGNFRPAGALFPWDAPKGRLVLTWKAGVDAVLWRELAAAFGEKPAGTPRFPWYFDWPRFRELLEGDLIAEEVRQDRWLADWKAIGRKTAESGFDRRRISPPALTEVRIPGLEGRWIGASPFAPPLDAAEGEPLCLFAGDSPAVWVSAKGVLHCSKDTWIFLPFFYDNDSDEPAALMTKKDD